MAESALSELIRELDIKARLASAVDYLLKIGGRPPQRSFLIQQRLILVARGYDFGRAHEAGLAEQAQIKEEAPKVVKAARELAQAMIGLPDTYLDNEFLVVAKIGKRAQSLIDKMASPGVGCPPDYATKVLVWMLATIYVLEFRNKKQPTISKNYKGAERRSEFHELACIVRKAIDPDRGDIPATTCGDHLKEWRAAVKRFSSKRAKINRKSGELSA